MRPWIARRTALVGVAVTMASLAGSAAAIAVPVSTTAGASASCLAPTIAANVWQRLPAPAGATAPVSMQQLDTDPCAMLAADASGRRWRSRDAGVHWTELTGGPPITQVTTERLQPRVGGVVMGPVLATGPDSTGPASAVPLVSWSGDNGRTFTSAQLSATVQTPTALPDIWSQADVALGPLWMNVESAATAVHFTRGQPQPYVYLAGRAPTTISAAASTNTANVLLKSTDGGRTFHPVASSTPVTPTVVAVDPTSPDVIWVNDIQPGRSGGGAWVSLDGGGSFANVCCANATVSDITITPTSDGGVSVLLATDQGLLRSDDGGSSWKALTGNAISGVRTPPDDPSTFLVQTAAGIEMSTGSKVRFAPVPGLPSGCQPSHLRGDANVPPTFLVDCTETGASYRLLLTRYLGRDASGSGGLVLPGAHVPDGQVPGSGAGATARPLSQLAVWSLPGSDTRSAAVAFDGTSIYYDMRSGGIGEVGRIRASDGVFLGVLHTGLGIASMGFDLKRNQLLIATHNNTLFALDVRTSEMALLGSAPFLPNYDASFDGLSDVPEGTSTLLRRARTGWQPPSRGCTFTNPTVASDLNKTVRALNATSTYVAAGDGGGYVQEENDTTLFRISRSCVVTGVYSHRVYSESFNENDAMACDTQSFFPQPVIWIRDADPGTVTAYGVPSGYCPMPSHLALSAPISLYRGSTADVCARLTNATTGLPARFRPVTVRVAGNILGHGQTDSAGVVCLPWVASTVFGVGAALPVRADFTGDSSLYPSQANTTVRVFAGVPPLPRSALLLTDVPPVGPPQLAVLNNPAPNPAPNALTAPAPVANPAPAPVAQGQAQAQSQPLLQGLLVPQREQQPQLVFVRALSQVELDTGNAMVATRRHSGPNAPVLPLGFAAVSLVLGTSLARTAVATVRARATRTPRDL